MTDISGEWQLTKASDGDGAIPVSGVAVTLVVQGTDLAGQAPCNDYSGSIELHGDTVTLGMIAASEKSCGDRMDALERRYLDAFFTVTGARLGEEILTLSGPEVTLRYALLPKKKIQ